MSNIIDNIPDSTSSSLDSYLKSLEASNIEVLDLIKKAYDLSNKMCDLYTNVQEEYKLHIILIKNTQIKTNREEFFEQFCEIFEEHINIINGKDIEFLEILNNYSNELVEQKQFMAKSLKIYLEKLYKIKITGEKEFLDLLNLQFKKSQQAIRNIEIKFNELIIQLGLIISAEN